MNVFNVVDTPFSTLQPTCAESEVMQPALAALVQKSRAKIERGVNADRRRVELGRFDIQRILRDIERRRNCRVTVAELLRQSQPRRRRVGSAGLERLEVTCQLARVVADIDDIVADVILADVDDFGRGYRVLLAAIQRILDGVQPRVVHPRLETAWVVLARG